MTSLVSLDISGFDTTSVTTTSYMFAYSGLKYLDLSSFDTRNCRTFTSMFFNCKDLEIKINKENNANLIRLKPSYVTILE